MKFNKIEAEGHINMLVEQYNIKVVQRSKSSSGWARYETNEIKIPHPTNIDKFGVCLHEINHIMEGNTKNGKRTKRYEQGFYADMFARNIMIRCGYDITEWDKRTQWHVLSRTAMATNRGCKEINKDVLKYFDYIDFSKWIGHNVFIGADKKFNNQTISIDYITEVLEFTPRNKKLIK